MNRKVPQIIIEAKPPRHVMIVERNDGTWNIYEDTETELLKYNPRRGERVSRHRAFVRRA